METSASAKPEGPKIKVQVTVEVDTEWIDFLTNYSDIFGQDYIGYWAYGVARDRKTNKGWLIWVNPEDGTEYKESHAAVVKIWRSGALKLPENYFRLDREVAIRAWVEGCEKFGVDWYQNGDANTYDYVIQMALFGEVVFG